MKSCIKILLCLGMFASNVYLYDIKAYGKEAMKACPPGCFCVRDGLMPAGNDWDAACEGDALAKPISCNTKDEVFRFDRGTLACNRSTGAVYYVDDFSELYECFTGMYGFIGEDLIVMPDFFLSTGGGVGMYACPASHPLSKPGTKTPYGCYTHDAKGNMVYYNNVTDSNDIKTLQNTLNKATQITQDLQRSVIRQKITAQQKNDIKTLATNLQNILNKATQITQDLQRTATQKKQANETNNNTVSNPIGTKNIITSNSVIKTAVGSKNIITGNPVIKTSIGPNMRKDNVLMNKSAVVH